MLTNAQLAELLKELEPLPETLARPDVGAFLQAADRRGTHGGDYKPWAKARYHEPRPTGLGRKQLQALFQYSRDRGMVSTPLLAVGAEAMRVNLSPATMDVIETITSFRALKEHPEIDAVPTVQGLEQFQVRSLIEEAFASSAIEGAVTSRKIAGDLARERRTPKSNSEQMMLNNWKALKALDRWRESPLSPELLCEIQETITRSTDLEESAVGQPRTTDDVRVIDSGTSEVIHVPPPASELPDRMRRLCAFANTTQPFPPLVRAILLHHQIGFDHPFMDGNGRTARVVFMLEATRDKQMNWLSYVPFSRTIAERKTSYYEAFLNTAENGWDTTYFVRHQLRCIALECTRLANYMAEFAARKAKYIQRLQLEDGLNVRQIAVIHSAFKHPNQPFSQRDHGRHHQVAPMTANRDLNQLVSWRLLSKRRAKHDARQFHYWPTKKLLGIDTTA